MLYYSQHFLMQNKQKNKRILIRNVNALLTIWCYTFNITFHNDYGNLQYNLIGMYKEYWNFVFSSWIKKSSENNWNNFRGLSKPTEEYSFRSVEYLQIEKHNSMKFNYFIPKLFCNLFNWFSEAYEKFAIKNKTANLLCRMELKEEVD